MDSFTCPQCNVTSHNPNDIQHRYCGNCHAFSPRKPYIKPAFRFEKVFTTSALSCGKVSDHFCAHTKTS